MNNTKDVLEKVFFCGKLGKNEVQTALILNVPVNELSEELKKSDSEITREYRRGIETGSYEIEKTLMEKAEKGDVKASKELRTRQHFTKIQRLKKELFNL